jgi:DNA invertase Pin-like site-specific DNA recombinase
MSLILAAIYARKSTDQSAVAGDQKSVARQLEQAKAYAAAHGWIVEDRFVFVDDGISGAEFAKRSGYMRLLNAVGRRAPFAVLIVSEPSRLGREQLETGYAMKQLAEAGVRIFSYLDDREVLLDTPIDKFMIAALNFGAEMERDKARQRQLDTMARKARAGHVTGGRVFGYANVPITDANGRRSHVEYVINDAEAAVVRRIFELGASGQGLTTIAKTLNREGARSPLPQQGRPASWARSSVRAVLFRDLYRGLSVWNRTCKRDRFGKVQPTKRPTAQWITAPAPRIVSEELWTAAHARREAARQLYLGATGGQRFGRPADARTSSKYLLTHLALCGICGGPLEVESRSHGKTRALFYGCAAHRRRGTCDMRRVLPMADANSIVIESLLDEILDPPLVETCIADAIQVLTAPETDDEINRVAQELARLDREQEKILAAIATGRQVSGIVEALQRLDQRRAQLQAAHRPDRASGAARRPDPARLRNDLIDLSQEWRRVLVEDPTHARPIVSTLLEGRVTFTPLPGAKRWQMTGVATLRGLLTSDFVQGLASPTGFIPYRKATPGRRGRANSGRRESWFESVWPRPHGRRSGLPDPPIAPSLDT